MKKKLLVIGLCSLTSVMMFSCKKDDPTPVTTELPTKYSAKTPEENKAQLEANGIKLLEDMELLKNLKGPEAIGSLANLLNTSGSSMRTSSGGILLQSIDNLRTGKGSSEEVFTSMRLTATATSLKTFFEENSGTYSWNSSIEDFDFVAGGSQIIFKYPAIETGLSNNAVLTFKDYQGTTSPTTIDGYEGDLPTKLLMELTVDGSKVMDYSFGAVYNSEGDPTSLTSKLTMTPFSFSINLSNTTQVAGFDYTLAKDSKTLISFGAAAKGDFKTTTFNTAEAESEIITEGSAHIQLLNIKIAGTINVDGIDKDQKANPSAKEVDIINKHTDLIVFYADSKEKIADTEFYTKSTTYNGYTSSYTDIRLVFADGSKVDFETYFNTGFDNLKTKLEEFME